MNKKKIDSLEKKINYKFNNKELLENALTHKTFAFEAHLPIEFNERIEFPFLYPSSIRFQSTFGGFTPLLLRLKSQNLNKWLTQVTPHSYLLAIFFLRIPWQVIK